MISPFYDQRSFHKIRSIKGAVKLIYAIVMLRGGSRISEGDANMDIYIRGKKVDTTTQHMEHVLSRGSRSMPPHETFTNLAY